MTIARMSDGRLVVHSAIALDEASMKEVEAWGTPAFLLVPNGYHRLDAPAWKRRYPQARVLAPRGSRKKIAEKVPVDGDVTELSDAALRVVPFNGIKNFEVALVVESNDGASVIVNDAVFNMPMPKKLLERLIVSAMGSAPGPRVSRLFKLLGVNDKAAFRADLETLAATPRLQRLIVAHTTMATGPAAAAALQKAATFV
jgi:hypothetical protein